MKLRQALVGNLGPNYIFTSANLIRWKLEVGRLEEDTKTTWTTCQLACNKIDSSMHIILLHHDCMYISLIISYLL